MGGESVAAQKLGVVACGLWLRVRLHVEECEHRVRQVRGHHLGIDDDLVVLVAPARRERLLQPLKRETAVPGTTRWAMVARTSGYYIAVWALALTPIAAELAHAVAVSGIRAQDAVDGRWCEDDAAHLVATVETYVPPPIDEARGPDLAVLGAPQVLRARLKCGMSTRVDGVELVHDHTGTRDHIGRLTVVPYRLQPEGRGMMHACVLYSAVWYGYTALYSLHADIRSSLCLQRADIRASIRCACLDYHMVHWLGRLRRRRRWSRWAGWALAAIVAARALSVGAVIFAVAKACALRVASHC